MHDAGPEAVVIRPARQVILRVAAYVLGFVFYGPLAMAVLLPFDLPYGHVAYYVVYALATAASLAWIHRSLKRMLNGCYFTLTTDALALGNEPATRIALRDVTDAIPVSCRQRAFRSPHIAVSPARFNVILLRLRDGSRLSISPLSNLQGFDRFFERLLQLLKPVWRESARFTPADLAALHSRRINKLQPPAVE